VGAELSEYELAEPRPARPAWRDHRRLPCLVPPAGDPADSPLAQERHERLPRRISDEELDALDRRVITTGEDRLEEAELAEPRESATVVVCPEW
jgi:hypothetical protein